MKKIVCVIPFSHSWFWLGTCVSSLIRNPPIATGFQTEIIVVNSSPWSPAIRAVTDTKFADQVTVMDNFKGNKFHASALDCVVEKIDFDYLMALETDVLALRPGWLQWFVDLLKPTDFACGHWHHESFINPSCTLYRGDVLREMSIWCKTEAPQDCLRWGERFEKEMPLDNNLPASENPAEILNNLKEWIGGTFAEKRGWPAGTVLKESPSGQLKSGGWYEPGQALHAWAVDKGNTYTVCPSVTTQVQRPNGILPAQTLYGGNGADPYRQLEFGEMDGRAETAHLWGGTRALDILKHPVTCQFVGGNTPYWLEREARFWLASVPEDVQKETLALIKRYGWHYKGQGTAEITQRDKDAAAFVQECYAKGGIVF